jgi:hypothetical protein
VDKSKGSGYIEKVRMYDPLLIRCETREAGSKGARSNGAKGREQRAKGKGPAYYVLTLLRSINFVAPAGIEPASKD